MATDPQTANDPNDTVTLSKSELADLIARMTGGTAQDPRAIVSEPGHPAEALALDHADAGAVASFPVLTTGGVNARAYVYPDGSVKLEV